MSETVTINKELDVRVDYVQCGECGTEIPFSVDSDSWGDLQITVGRHSCGQED